MGKKKEKMKMPFETFHTWISHIKILSCKHRRVIKIKEHSIIIAVPVIFDRSKQFP